MLLPAFGLSTFDTPADIIGIVIYRLWHLYTHAPDQSVLVPVYMMFHNNMIRCVCGGYGSLNKVGRCESHKYPYHAINEMAVVKVLLFGWNTGAQFTVTI